MLEMRIVVRDPVSGEDVDPLEVGFDGVVGLIRGRPPGGPPMSSVQCLEQADRLVSYATALRAAAIAAVADDTPGGRHSGQPVDEVAAALVVSRRSATWLHAQAESLRNHPGVWAAMCAGRLDPTRGRVLAAALDLVAQADADGVVRPAEDVAGDRARLLEAGLAYADAHTARQLDLFLQRILSQMDPGCSVRRRRQALDGRGVWLDHRGDGTSDLTARLASEDAERLYAAIRAHALAGARQEPADPAAVVESGPFELRLAAALLDLVVPVGSAEGGPPRGRVSAVINVTIPVDSLAGLVDTPGTVSGFGVLPADVARRLAAGDARWRHVLIHSVTGAVLDVGTLSYRPPAAMARLVRLRDGTCRFPGCRVPAAECDLDHLIPFPDGPTSVENLHALCRGHHGVKHDGGWTVEGLPGAVLRWTSPLGVTSTTYPADDMRAAA